MQLSGLSARLWTKGLPVRFPVRAHAWVSDQVPRGGHGRSNHTLMFFFPFFLFSPLSKKKQIKYFKKYILFNLAFFLGNVQGRVSPHFTPILELKTLKLDDHCWLVSETQTLRQNLAAGCFLRCVLTIDTWRRVGGSRIGQRESLTCDTGPVTA